MYTKYVSRIVPNFKHRNKIGLYVVDAGYIEAMSNYECKSRVLADYYIIIILSGKGSLVSKDKHYDIKSGDMYFLFPNVLHAYKTDEKDLMSHIWVGFNGTNAKMMLSKVDVDEKNPVVKCGAYSKSFEYVKEIYNVLEDERLSSEFKATGYLYNIFADLSIILNRDIEFNPNKKKQFTNPIERSIEFIESNYANPISVSMIAEFAGLSRSYFSTLFLEQVGVTPLEYLKSLRTEQALYYFANTQLTIKEVAHSVGYDNGLYFSKDFSKRFGMCPSEYIKVNRRIN